MRVVVWSGCLLALWGCNTVLGIGEASLDPLAAAAGGGQVVGAGGADASSVPAEGDSCAQEGTLFCGSPADGSHERAVLSCEAGQLTQVFECPGVQACIDGSTNTSVACGTGDVNLAYAQAEAPCGAEGAATCSFDALVLLECEAGFWIESRHCAPSRCAMKLVDGQRGLSCENGGYSEGDRCGFTAGKVVCSTDLSAVLACDGGTTTVKEQCTGSAQCTSLANGSLGCG